MKDYYTETTVDQLQLGDWIDWDLGPAEVIAITEKSIRIAYFTCRHWFSTPAEYTEFDPRFESRGDQWDGFVRTRILPNCDLFRYGARKTVRKMSSHRGRVRAIWVAKIRDKDQALWNRDFYIN